MWNISMMILASDFIAQMFQIYVVTIMEKMSHDY